MSGDCLSPPAYKFNFNRIKSENGNYSNISPQIFHFAWDYLCKIWCSELLHILWIKYDIWICMEHIRSDQKAHHSPHKALENNAFRVNAATARHTSHYHMLCWLNMLQVYPVHHFIINDKRLCKPQNHIYRAHIFITELIDIWNWFCATYINDNICMCSVYCICSNIKCMLSPGGILLYIWTFPPSTST